MGVRRVLDCFFSYFTSSLIFLHFGTDMNTRSSSRCSASEPSDQSRRRLTREQARAGKEPVSPQESLIEEEPTPSQIEQPPPDPSLVHKSIVGDRYVVPNDEFEHDSDSGNDHMLFRYGVVSRVERGTTVLWFDGDTHPTRYPGRCESWTAYLTNLDDCSSEQEDIFTTVEMAAGIRANHPPVIERTSRRNRPTRISRQTISIDTSREDAESAIVVDTWESDAEDDESEENPTVNDPEDLHVSTAMDSMMARARWENISQLRSDPRGGTNSMPETITPVMCMPSYADESWLNWFLYWMPVHVLRSIVDATNAKAKTIPYPASGPWKHLRIGEFMRWLGLWVLMTVYPCPGDRRNYWRSLLNFGVYMSEKRFE